MLAKHAAYLIKLRRARTSFTTHFFFFNDPATPEIYPLSLHAPLPISPGGPSRRGVPARPRSEPGTAAIWHRPATPTSPRSRAAARTTRRGTTLAARPSPPGTPRRRDRKSTRLNSSHGYISYAVFCLKK